ncbi:helix-hairpin-helix domain-containing protein [Prevotella sp. PCHR]|uniref:Helix-hairpin-helix domain-containing protein n=1 Tax=Xylanibacter caecicola TaxID=2736294 RepID=A0ABX2B3R7_9BACT|nr:helix-hairpin-helix domain-containing protein [Xylanibacter caecicola]NPE26161.1 helix-hairpin-helix domain-containing protein [Xylanibacter caecicola]
MRRLFLSAMISVFALCAAAQGHHEWEGLLYQVVETEDIEADAWDAMTDALADLEQNPININTATRDDLAQIPFLTDREIEAICAYIHVHGAMKTTGELAMTGIIGRDKCRLLPFFLYAGEQEKKLFPDLGTILSKGRHSVIATAKVPLYSRRGDRDGYLGYKYRHDVRYSFNFSDRVKAGIVGAQDAGEPFFAGRNRMGYDYYSFYLMIRKMGCLKALAVGRYRIGLGMGLVVNGNFSLGKTSALASLGRMDNVIRVHSSRSDGNYLQGAAATVEVANGLDLTAFVSYRDIDATLNSDKETVSTIVKTGYHRTQTEMDKKNNTSQTLFGGNIHYFKSGFHAGATAVYTSLDRELKPKTSQIYRRHYAAGRRFWNVSAEYGYTGHRLSVRGETATGGCHAVATANTVSFGVLPELDIMLLQRFYSFRYYSLFSRGFSEGGAVQNESGVYAGADWRPVSRLHVTAYVDFARFAWPKYRASDTSQASDNFVSATYTAGSWTFSSRYRLKIRQYDNEEKTSIINKTEHRMRASVRYEGAQWSMRTQADFVSSSYKKSSRGWMISHDVKCSPVRWLMVDASASIFDTDDYDSRVYAYEHGMLYSVYFPAFYGRGIRYALFANADISRLLTVSAKLGTTDYFDRDHIGSGMQQTDRSSVTDVEVQARIKF